MAYISDDVLDRLIREDIPYLDLTTHSLKIGGQKGRIVFRCRQEAVVCGTEEAVRILTKLNIQTLFHTPSGDTVPPGTAVLEAEGKAASLHTGWKVCQNLLEHYSGVASRTARLVSRAQAVNPAVQVVSTRKVIPGTKELAIKAVLAGGGMPHRLGLSETILVFEQHTNFMGGLEGFLAAVESLKKQNPEKKIIAEAKTVEEGLRLTEAGVDGVQFDKVGVNLLLDAVKQARSINSAVSILAAGGINEGNVTAIAGTGVDAIVTSAMYYGPPADFGVDIFVL